MADVDSVIYKIKGKGTGGEVLSKVVGNLTDKKVKQKFVGFKTKEDDD